MTFLGLLIMGLGVFVIISALRRRGLVPPPALPSTVGSVIGGTLVFFVGSLLMGLGTATLETGFSPTAQTRTQVETAPKPTMSGPVVEPAPEPVTTPEPPAPTNSSGRSELQNLAIISGLSENDPELIARYARIQELCPTEKASIGDMVVTMQRLVHEDSGRVMELTEVMRQLAIAQEGGREAGMSCSETGGMLVSLLVQGM